MAKTENDSKETIERNLYFFQGTSDILQNSNAEEAESAIKSKIQEFFNLKNVHFLLGSGTSCQSIGTMKDLYKSLCKVIDERKGKKGFIDLFKTIKTSCNGNLEEMLSVLYSKREYLRGVGKEQSDDFKNTKSLIETIETHIFTKINVKEESENYFQDLSIYQKFYQKLALRNKDMARINVFTTNNDLFNERALDSLSIHYINGFGGGLEKYFNPALFNYTFSKRLDSSISKYEPIENLVYLYKIHGSINWIEDNSNINSYFKVKEQSSKLIEKADNNVLIYPTPMKQNKSLGSPYVDLFREFQHKLLEPNSVLFVIGYSFSDEHVNDIIYRALATNTTFNLVVINDIKNECPITKIPDNRIYRLWGQIGEHKIHYFDYIVEKLLPDLDAFRETLSLEDFVRNLNTQSKEVQ